MNIQVVDIPVNATGRAVMWGRFSEVLTQVEALPEKKCVRLDAMTRAEIDTLRSAARFRKLALHIRTTEEATFVWLNQKSTERKKASQ